MKKSISLGIAYNKDKVKRLINTYFHDNPIMLDMCAKMERNEQRLFLAVFEGKTVSTTGYQVNPDYTIHRASAVVHRLRDLNIPIRTTMIPVYSKESTSRQGLFSLDSEYIALLQTRPQQVFDEFKRQRLKEKKERAKRTLRRMKRELGKEVFAKLAKQVSRE